MSPPDPLRVLLVDDDVTVLSLMEKILLREGYAVTAVETAEQAIGQLELASFDLLVTDKNLPGLDGAELARLARLRSERLAIVMVTGYATTESADRLVGVADAYVTKPFDLKVFRRVLSEAVERRRFSPAAAERVLESPAEGAVLISTDARQAARWSRLLRTIGWNVQVAASLGDLETARRPAALLVESAAFPREGAPAIWRQQGKNPALKVVLLSPGPSIDESVKAVALAARAHLFASDSDAQLTAALQRALG